MVWELLFTSGRVKYWNAVVLYVVLGFDGNPFCLTLFISGTTFWELQMGPVKTSPLIGRVWKCLVLFICANKACMKKIRGSKMCLILFLEGIWVHQARCPNHKLFTGWGDLVLLSVPTVKSFSVWVEEVGLARFIWNDTTPLHGLRKHTQVKGNWSLQWPLAEKRGFVGVTIWGELHKPARNGSWHDLVVWLFSSPWGKWSCSWKRFVSNIKRNPQGAADVTIYQKWSKVTGFSAGFHTTQYSRDDILSVKFHCTQIDSISFLTRLKCLVTGFLFPAPHLLRLFGPFVLFFSVRGWIWIWLRARKRADVQHFSNCEQRRTQESDSVVTLFVLANKWTGILLSLVIVVKLFWMPNSKECLTGRVVPPFVVLCLTSWGSGRLVRPV